MYDAAERKM